jgi:hypothetical protein
MRASNDGCVTDTLYARPYRFPIRVKHKLLPKDLWATFGTRAAALQYDFILGNLCKTSSSVAPYRRSERCRRAS